MRPYIFIKTDKTCKEIEENNKNSTINKAYESQKKDKLTRVEKNEIARLCYGVFGAAASTCRLMGLAYPFKDSKHTRRILVKFKYSCGFEPYYAPDKTALRKALQGQQIDEMIYTK